MRFTRLPVSILFLAAALGCGGGTTAPDLGFIIQAIGNVPTTAVAGSAIQLTAKVLHRESGGATTPASGKVVTLTVTSVGATINGATTTTVTTAADGSASATWLLGTTIGPQTLRGSVSATEFLDFTINATAPPATQLALTTPPSATAQSGAALAQQPRVQLKDANGTNVAEAGVPVTVSIATGGGTLGGTATVNSDASGLATFSGLVLSGVTGTVTLRFTATLNGSTVTVTSQGVAVAPPPAPTQFVIVTQPATSASSDVLLTRQPTIQLKDVNGNNTPQAGVPVTVSIASGGGTVGGTLTVNSDATGLATFSDLSVSGPARTVTLNFSATLNGQSASVASSGISVALSQVTAVTFEGVARMKVGQITGYGVVLRIANGTIVQRTVAWSILVPATATITGTGVVNPLQAGTISIVATIDGVAWVKAVPSYDWVAVTGGPTTSVGLTSQDPVTNFAGAVEFPILSFECTSGVFSVKVSFTGIITASGAVTYTWTNAVPVNETWLDSGPAFHVLTYPGATNLARKNFALGVAANWTQFFSFDFSFGELSHGSHATAWNLTGINAALAPVIAACPGN